MTGKIMINGVERNWLYSIKANSIFQKKLQEYEERLKDSSIEESPEAQGLDHSFMLVHACLLAWDYMRLNAGLPLENDNITHADIEASATKSYGEFLRTVSEISALIQEANESQPKKKLNEEAEK